MDYHNRMIEERDTKIKELEGEIERLEGMLKQYEVREEEEAKRLAYLENKIGLD